MERRDRRAGRGQERRASRAATANYAALQASFWMDLCIALSFAAVFLQGTGFTNSACGAIIAAGSLTSALLGPALSSLIDRSETITASGLMPPLIITRGVVILILLTGAGGGALTGVFFALYIGLGLSVNSLILKLYVDAGWSGIKINYGAARGCGSLAYVVISLIMGKLVSTSSVRIVIMCAAAVCIFQLAAYAAFAKELRKTPAREAVRAKAAADKNRSGSGLLKFASENRRFCLLLAGTLLIFFSHNTMCNFLINVTENVGGNAADMGLLNGFMAAVEIPVMLLFSRVFGRSDMTLILKAAFVFFVLKAAAVAAAQSVPMMAAALLLQAPSFALYTPAIVPYIERTIRPEDAAKAQSLAFTMTTLSSVLVGIISGALLDHTSVTTTLWIAAAVCLAGTIASIAGLERSGRETSYN